MKLYSIIIAFIIGVILTIFSYQAYTIYELRAVVADDHNTIQSVVNFLNTQIQASQNANKSTQTQQIQQQAPSQVQQTAPATKK
jgi:Tfp pilus assembly protein PilE